MLLKAPPGVGNPSIGGVTIEPKRGGIYDVDEATGRHLIEAFGFFDPNAPKAKPVAPTPDSSDGLRDGVVAVLKSAGAALGDTSDKTLLAALGNLGAQVDAHVVAQVKVAQDPLRDDIARQTKRADDAEAKVAELTARVAAADKALTELTEAQPPKAGQKQA